MARWSPISARIVGPDGEQAIGALRELQAVMDERYRELLARGQKGATR